MGYAKKKKIDLCLEKNTFRYNFVLWILKISAADVILNPHIGNQANGRSVRFQAQNSEATQLP